jgi:predicted ferric reductase
MEYGPALPATGGGFGLGLVWGITNQSWLVIAYAVIGLAITAYCFFKLRKGERKLNTK